MKSRPFRTRFVIWYALPEVVNSATDLETDPEWYIFEPHNNIGDYVTAIATCARAKQEHPKARIWFDKCESYYPPSNMPANAPVPQVVSRADLDKFKVVK